jgi:hypothetical protein
MTYNYAIWHLFYNCPKCDGTWEDHWASIVDGQCPECGLKSIQPYDAKDDTECFCCEVKAAEAVTWDGEPVCYGCAINGDMRLACDPRKDEEDEDD